MLQMIAAVPCTIYVRLRKDRHERGIQLDVSVHSCACSLSERNALPSTHDDVVEESAGSAWLLLLCQIPVPHADEIEQAVEAELG